MALARVSKLRNGWTKESVHSSADNNSERYKTMFNLKKTAKKTQEVGEKMLEPQREELHTKMPTGTMNTLLEPNRKDGDGLKTIEDQLGAVHTKPDGNKTTEAQIDDQDPGPDMPKRTGNDKFDQLPINLLEEKAHQDKIKAFAKEQVIDSETEFWDDYLTSDEAKPIRSQLQNHADRFDKLKDGDIMKNRGVREMVMASVQDADGMLYHIYRTAAEQHRELTKDEQMLVDGITFDKKNLVAQLY